MLMFFQKIRKNKKGFTLTELIVVVAILGVLAAVATPLIASNISDARERTDDANAKTIENIIKRAIAKGSYKDSDGDDQAFTVASLATAATVTACVESELNPIPDVQQETDSTDPWSFYVNDETGEVTAIKDSADTDDLTKID